MTIFKMAALAGAAAVAFGLAGAASAETNLIQDGSFEGATDGVLSAAWSHNGWGAATGGTFTDTAADGLEYAFATCSGADCTDPNATGIPRLSQTIGGLASGDTYTLAFQYDPDIFFRQLVGTNELKVLWNGAVVMDLLNLSPTFKGFSTSFTSVAGANTLTFLARQDASTLGLDAVSLTKAAAAAVPEPADWTLMIGGFGLAGATLRRSRRSRRTVGARA